MGGVGIPPGVDSSSHSSAHYQTSIYNKRRAFRYHFRSGIAGLTLFDFLSLLEELYKDRQLSEDECCSQLSTIGIGWVGTVNIQMDTFNLGWYFCTRVGWNASTICLITANIDQKKPLVLQELCACLPNSFIFYHSFFILPGGSVLFLFPCLYYYS